jgi:AcrR family transcriptional regulator
MSKETTAERILRAGTQCFAERGYRGATTRILAEAAGVNVATLAYHFKDKEGLYRAAVNALYEHLFAIQPDLTLLAGGSVEERIERLVRFAYAYLREHTLEVRLLLRHVIEEGRLPAPVEEHWRDELLVRAQAAWTLIGLPADPGWKLKLLALNHLFVRFAVSGDSELLPFAEENPHQEVEDLLVKLAQGVLLGGRS